MQVKDFNYILPEHLIAQEPLVERDSSNLLILDKQSGEIQDEIFSNIVDHLGENDVLVVNKTRVIKARLKGKVTLKVRKTEREVEVFLHKQVGENTWDCMVYPGKRFGEGVVISFYDDDNNLLMTGKTNEITEVGRIITFYPAGDSFFDTLEKIGKTPLPPYIKKDIQDSERYQTVYNKDMGSVAAPTAGLHFTEDLFTALKEKGVKIEEVLLHVGLGTFSNIREAEVEKHEMHSEYIELEDIVANRLNAYKSQGRRIIAVGTTSVRVLESFTDEDGVIHSGQKETDIFIYPGYKWKFIHSMITNFHLPESTLLMLVSSLAGQENIKKAYSHAIDQEYRFFSFGDAMWIQ